MLGAEFSSKRLSENIAALKCRVMRAHSHFCVRGSDKPWDEFRKRQEPYAVISEFKKNEGETMTFDNIIRLTLICRVFRVFIYFEMRRCD